MFNIRTAASSGVQDELYSLLGTNPWKFTFHTLNVYWPGAGCHIAQVCCHKPAQSSRHCERGPPANRLGQAHGAAEEPLLEPFAQRV